MSNKVPVGISDIAIYLPKQKIELQKVIEHRETEENGIKIAKLLKRALHKTGLSTLHFPKNWEDSVTMAAQSAYQLIKRGNFSLERLRYLVSGTETAVDHSKPIASYVNGILKKAGISIPQTISTFQTQHACAGGTIALLSVAALLGIGGSDESGIVICSDIARYEPSTSAEVTQGAGAVALLIEPKPRLLSLNLQNIGYCSNDVDDFFRPLDSKTAKVKGSYSINCYREAMEGAFVDYAKRRGKSVKNILEETDMFALHVPYPKLPLETMHYLLAKYADLNENDAAAFLEKRGFSAMIEPAAKSGNIYTGSLFLSLAFLLKDRLAKFGNEIIGKKVLLGSYGSGNTMALIEGTITDTAPAIIENWDLNAIWCEKTVEFQEYKNWIKPNPNHVCAVLPNSFYLDNIRDDGYREYLFKE